MILLTQKIWCTKQERMLIFYDAFLINEVNNAQYKAFRYHKR